MLGCITDAGRRYYAQMRRKQRSTYDGRRMGRKHQRRCPMTPARQPQECKTCIHDGKFETQCRVMSGHYYNVCAISKIQVIEGKPIIRCSTHTSAPAPEELHCDKCRFVKDCSLLYFPPCEKLARRDEQHHREAAKAAREQFIEQIEDKLPRYPSDLGDMYLLSDIQSIRLPEPQP